MNHRPWTTDYGPWNHEPQTMLGLLSRLHSSSSTALGASPSNEVTGQGPPEKCQRGGNPCGGVANNLFDTIAAPTALDKHFPLEGPVVASKPLEG